VQAYDEAASAGSATYKLSDSWPKLPT